jgi:hypothetical protein
MLLGGCAASAVDSKPVVQLSKVTAAPPAGLTRACDDPATIPDGPASAGSVERLWAKDRASLVSCKGRHAAVVSFYAKRDKGLSTK